MNNINNLGISMRNSADIQAHSISLIKDNRVVSLEKLHNRNSRRWWRWKW